MVETSRQPSPVSRVCIRDARDEDADELMQLIAGCFAEYSGCVLDVDGEIPELRAIRSHYRALSGRVWVVEVDDHVAGCVAVRPTDAGQGMELQKLYVAEDARRRGLGLMLCNLAEEEARRRGASWLELWTDTRFENAHRLYRRAGFTDLGATRELHDKSGTVEFHYRKDLPEDD